RLDPTYKTVATKDSSMALKYGRVTIDERGVRKARFLFIFGSSFDLTWSEITGWAIVDCLLTGGGNDQLLSQTLELHTTETLHCVSGSGPYFAAIVKEIERRRPTKRIESTLEMMRR